VLPLEKPKYRDISHQIHAPFTSPINKTIILTLKLRSGPAQPHIAKFTHSGSQINDWTPEGSMAKTRHIYPDFIMFIKDTMQELRYMGHDVELAGIFYHVGENDMSMGPYRDKAAKWLHSAVVQSRQDLAMPALKWFVSQQPPTDHKDVNRIDVTSALEAIAAADQGLIHIKAFDLPKQEKQLVIDTRGIVELGELIARRYLAQE